MRRKEKREVGFGSRSSCREEGGKEAPPAGGDASKFAVGQRRTKFRNWESERQTIEKAAGFGGEIKKGLPPERRGRK